MKKFTYIFHTAAFLLFTISCDQEVVDPSANPCPSDDPSIICPQAPPPPPCPDGATAGDADFSKFVALGTSYTAGFQAGALFTEGQNNSLGQILATQFACVGGGAFNQPSINSEHGFNLLISPNPMGTTVLGRFRLQGDPPAPAPMISGAEAIPNPQVNPAFLYAGDKTTLNNFSVPTIFLRQIFTPAAGNWGNPNPAEGFTPFYARFASIPGTSTILTDAASKAPTFLLFWMGMDDYLLHAAFGGDGRAPLTPVEGGIGAGFAATYGAAIASFMAPNANLKGVVANFPSVFALPYFNLVPYNPIPMSAELAAAANAGYAGYNQILEGLKGAPFNLPAAAMDARKISFAAGANPFVIEDETLMDLGDIFDMLAGAQQITAEQRLALAPLEQVRLTTASDRIPLSAGSVLGTLANPNNPASVRGVGVPLGDAYALIPSEIAEIESARTAYNTVISQIATSGTYADRLALADLNSGFDAFVTNQAAIIDKLTITPNLTPPTGIYSEDGLHPNSRGYAFIANMIIDAINAKFGASVPKANLGVYPATGLPIAP